MFVWPLCCVSSQIPIIILSLSLKQYVPNKRRSFSNCRWGIHSVGENIGCVVAIHERDNLIFEGLMDEMITNIDRMVKKWTSLDSRDRSSPFQERNLFSSAMEWIRMQKHGESIPWHSCHLQPTHSWPSQHPHSHHDTHCKCRIDHQHMLPALLSEERMLEVVLYRELGVFQSYMPHISCTVSCKFCADRPPI